MLGYKTKVLLFGYLYFIVVGLFCFYFKLHFVISTGLFVLLPVFILMYLKRGIGKELSLFAWSLGIPVGLYTQIVAERNNLWKYIPFLPNFHLKDIPLEALLWYPCWFGLVISTYLFFFDKHKHKFNLKRHAKYFSYCLVVLIISIILINLNIYYSVFPYAYISLISPLVLISIFLFFFNKHKNFFKVFIPTTLILFLPMLFYDLIGVYSHQWVFGGNYVYVINFGFAKLPIEEFVIWLWIWPSSVIAYFQEFESDFK